MIRPVISTVLLVILVWALQTKFGPVPPMGKFLDPQGGFWANAETNAPAPENISLPQLNKPVDVYFDERRVPHVFAENEHDLYMIQGYLQARDRLFQMELQTYDASGRLAEIIGPQLLERDRQTRRLGLPYGAEQAMKAIEKDSASRAILEAYSAGINAWINNLEPEDYPLEYKILDIDPEEWKPIKTALLLKNMTRTLAGRNSDDRTSNTLALFGKDYVDTFFTQKPDLLEPIIPPERKWNFDPDLPEAPESLYVSTIAQTIGSFERPEGIGSNNWAVSGDKTASGYPILSNDPHLSLTLPSIWYEMQLHAPGINTYGVTLQGAPGIIIGFNEHVAWGVTNVGSDVMDWYEITFKDKNREEYLHDGVWKPVTRRIEKIKVRGEQTVTDTVLYTHHGPVSEIESPLDEDETTYYALEWIAHEPTNEMRAFYGLNRAKNYDDYVAALSHYKTPAQNFVFASNEGDIALWVNGLFPKKWRFQGRTVSDGSDSRYDWQGWIPHEQVPHIKNPERGFVSSANQESAAPDYPHYLGDDFAPFERGRRINDLLSGMNDITIADVQTMQMDNYSYYAATLLPYLLKWVNTDSLSATGRDVFEDLENWDYHMQAEQVAPSVFREWSGNFYRSVLTDEYEQTEAPLRYPSRDRLVEVVTQNPDFPFIDDVNTPNIRETREILALNSFRESLQQLEDEFGGNPGEWQWGVVIDNDLNHLAFIPGLGAEDLFSSGAADAINATRGSAGPSWRMVVELGPEVTGYGVYPGGQSGNPGSPGYDEMVEPWRTGQLFELHFLKDPPEEFMYTLNFTN